MGVRFRWCDHRTKATYWRDTAGMEWADDECMKCGRIWRNRLIPFARSTEHRSTHAA